MANDNERDGKSLEARAIMHNADQFADMAKQVSSSPAMAVTTLQMATVAVALTHMKDGSSDADLIEANAKSFAKLVEMFRRAERHMATEKAEGGKAEGKGDPAAGFTPETRGGAVVYAFPGNDSVN